MFFSSLNLDAKFSLIFHSSNSLLFKMEEKLSVLEFFLWEIHSKWNLLLPYTIKGIVISHTFALTYSIYSVFFHFDFSYLCTHWHQRSCYSCIHESWLWKKMRHKKRITYSMPLVIEPCTVISVRSRLFNQVTNSFSTAFSFLVQLTLVLPAVTIFVSENFWPWSKTIIANFTGYLPS